MRNVLWQCALGVNLVSECQYTKKKWYSQLFPGNFVTNSRLFWGVFYSRNKLF